MFQSLYASVFLKIDFLTFSVSWRLCLLEKIEMYTTGCLLGKENLREDSSDFPLDFHEINKCIETKT